MALALKESRKRKALREAITALPKTRYGSIVVEDSGGLRARIVRNGNEISLHRGFRLSRFEGSIERTHEAAREWLNSVGTNLPALTRLHRKSTKHKNSNLPSGVSGGHHTDPRTGLEYLSIMVLYRDGSGRRSKTFRVGRPEWIDARIYNSIADVACAFRAAYVVARDKGEVFDSTRWRHWRELLPDDVQEDLLSLRKLSNQERR